MVRIVNEIRDRFEALMGRRKLVPVPIPVPVPVVAVVRSRLWWLALAALPLIVAACNNGGGSGY